MLKILTYLIFSFVLLISCARIPNQQPLVVTIADINVENKNTMCISQCSNSFNQCTNNAFGDGFALSECKNSYKICSDKCPTKN
jgi:hypothetical protein